MFTCTALRHALLEWERKKGDHPKVSKSKLKADRPDCSNFINHKNHGGKIASCCPVMGRKLLTSPGVADTYTFLMNTWNTLPESYQQRVFNNTLATVKRQIQQAENPIPAVVISLEAAHFDNVIHLHYLASEVAFGQPEIRRTDQNIPIDNNCTDDELHFGMPGGSGDYEDEDDESDDRDAMPTARRRRRPTMELERFDQGTIDVDGYEGEDGDDAEPDADEEEEASQADDGSTQNVDDWPGKKWCWQVWVRGWRRCEYGCGGRSITSWWWINAECGGLMALYQRVWRLDSIFQTCKIR